jgi:hypothetical protein
MNTKIFTITSILLLLAGCASVAVTDKAIEDRTAFALNLEKGSFKVIDRVNDGLETSYTVTTNTGKKYNCRVEGSFSFGTGRVVTDPVCNEVGKPANTTKCDSLSKAAGKCK